MSGLTEEQLRGIEEYANNHGVPDEILTLVAEVRKLREALEWYATSANYMHTFDRAPLGTDKVEAGWRPVVLDAGQRARVALGTVPK
jgi:hypothetical protein